MKKILFAATAAAALIACDGEGSAASSAEVPVAEERVEEVAPPEDGAWSDVVTRTEAGGYMLGNPEAPIALVEYASMTCPACAYFSQTGTEPLMEYVDSGRVSFELRNYIRDPIDTTAALLARCGSEDRYFPMTEALFENQNQWFQSNVQSLQQVVNQSGGMAASERFPAIAEAAGLKTFAVQRGLPASQAEACLADEAAAEQLITMQNEANADFDISGTPSFLINGALAEANQWQDLEPILRRALGEE